MTERTYSSTWTIASSPHLGRKDSVATIMYWVAGTLLLPTLGALYYFRGNALRVILVTVVSALLSEFIVLKIRKKDTGAVFDGSALVTGLLLALTLPPSLKSSYCVIGAAAAIIFGKQLFGGLGSNIFNPALVGRAFLQAAFPIAMTTWTPTALMEKVDAITFATPLGGFKFSHALTELKPMILGNIGGCLGETSALLVLVGALILVSKGYMDWKIPAGILFTVFLFTGTLHLLSPLKYASPLFHLFGGGLFLGAFYMATDMVTSPRSSLGTWIYAFFIGLLVVVIRIFGGLPEGVMYSILIVNTFVPILDRYIKPKIFGEGAKR